MFREELLHYLLYTTLPSTTIVYCISVCRPHHCAVTLRTTVDVFIKKDDYFHYHYYYYYDSKKEAWHVLYYCSVVLLLHNIYYCVCVQNKWQSTVHSEKSKYSKKDVNR